MNIEAECSPEFPEPPPPLRSIHYPGFLTRTSMIQLGYGVWAAMVIIGVGMTFGFSAVTLPELVVDETIETPNEAESAWIASVINLTAPLGCVLCGWIMDKCGRKPALIFCQVPMAIGWFYIWRALTPTEIIIGRSISGIGCGMAASAPRPYITEITLPNMRASVGVLITLSISLGITLEATLGSLMKWRLLSFIGGMYSIIFLVANIFLPETPYYVLMTSTISKARKTLEKFRGVHYDINKEMESLLYFRDVNQIRRLTTKELIKSLVKPIACKPFWVVFPYIFISQASGITILFYYTIEILKESKSSVDLYAGNIALGATRTVFGVIVSILLFKVKRRPLAFISATGVAATCMFLFLYTSSTEDATVVPQLGFVVYVAFATLGYYSLPILIAFELIPLQIRGLLGGIIIAVTNLTMFVAIQAFPFINKALTLPYTLFAFGICSALGAIFVYAVIPETKNLTLQQIEEYFNKGVPPPSSGVDYLSSSSHSFRDIPQANRKKKLRNIFKRRKRSIAHQSTFHLPRIFKSQDFVRPIRTSSSS